MYSPDPYYPSGLPKPEPGCRFTPFCPSPEQTEELVHALASPEFSLRSIAEQHGTTLEALTSWMALPEIQERLDNLEQACARRVRLVANTHLQSTVTCLTLLIDDFKDEINHTLLPHGKAPPLHILEHRRRSRDTIRKVCSLLLRLSNYHPSKGPPRRRAIPTPSPSGLPEGVADALGGRGRSSDLATAPAPELSLPDLLKLIEQTQAAATSAGLTPITIAPSTLHNSDSPQHPQPPTLSPRGRGWPLALERPGEGSTCPSRSNPECSPPSPTHPAAPQEHTPTSSPSHPTSAIPRPTSPPPHPQSPPSPASPPITLPSRSDAWP